MGDESAEDSMNSGAAELNDFVPSSSRESTEGLQIISLVTPREVKTQLLGEETRIPEHVKGTGPTPSYIITSAITVDQLVDRIKGDEVFQDTGWSRKDFHQSFLELCRNEPSYAGSIAEVGGKATGVWDYSGTRSQEFEGSSRTHYRVFQFIDQRVSLNPSETARAILGKRVEDDDPLLRALQEEAEDSAPNQLLTALMAQIYKESKAEGKGPVVFIDGKWQVFTAYPFNARKKGA
ncbi:hypothetical protein HYU13_00840 [Candidatus Woesearchaeota archaeon]|nr:hypothetical protein [Candidatus Woesearchaeota archaeon]